MSEQALMKVSLDEEWQNVMVDFDVDGESHQLIASYESWESEELEDTDEHTFYFEDGEHVVIDDMLFSNEPRKLTKERAKNYWDYFRKNGFNIF